MTEETLTDIEFDNESEAVDALAERIENKETRDELLEVIDQAAGALIDECGLDTEIDCDSLARGLTIGYAEWICRFLDSGVKNPESLPRLIDDVRDDPIHNSQIVLGRMGDRSRPCLLVSRAMWSQRRSSKTC